MQQEINLKTMSLTELKALKSDERDQLDMHSQNIALLNAEINLRLQELQNKQPTQPSVENNIDPEKPLETDETKSN